jgi:hypothetical protein
MTTSTMSTIQTKTSVLRSLKSKRMAFNLGHRPTQTQMRISVVQDPNWSRKMAPTPIMSLWRLPQRTKILALCRQTQTQSSSEPWSQLRCPCEARSLVVLRAMSGFQAHFQIDQQPPVCLQLQLQTQQLSKPWTQTVGLQSKRSVSPRHKFTESSVRSSCESGPNSCSEHGRGGGTSLPRSCQT